MWLCPFLTMKAQYSAVKQWKSLNKMTSLETCVMCGVAIVRPYTGVKDEQSSVCQQCYNKESLHMQHKPFAQWQDGVQDRSNVQQHRNKVT